MVIEEQAGPDVRQIEPAATKLIANKTRRSGLRERPLQRPVGTIGVGVTHPFMGEYRYMAERYADKGTLKPFAVHPGTA